MGIVNLTEADIIAIFGPPDATTERMLSTQWLCSQCGKLHVFDEPVRPPAPCECGGIAFESRK